MVVCSLCSDGDKQRIESMSLAKAMAVRSQPAQTGFPDIRGLEGARSLLELCMARPKSGLPVCNFGGRRC